MKLFILFVLLFTALFSKDKKATDEALLKEIREMKSRIQNLEKQVKTQEEKPNTQTDTSPASEKTEEDEPNPKSDGKPPKAYPGAKAKGVKIGSLNENEGKRYAIVIGINDYNDTTITDLSKARNDAKVMGTLLKEKGQFDKVFLMTDDVNVQGENKNLYPTRLNILAKLDSVLSFSSPQDLVVFFFSGHGISDYEENGYLITVDTLSEHKFNSSLKVQEIVERFKRKKLKKTLLILDACREKVNTSKSVQQSPLKQERFDNAEVAATFYSTKAGYFSYEDDSSDYGVFTKYLVYGLEGKGDDNKDGVVTFSELQTYVQNGVRDWSMKRNEKQKPYVKIYGEQYGDLALSISPEPPKEGESLADKKVISKTSSPYVWRSMVFPGWGQHYGDAKNRGYAYMGTGLLFGYYYMNQRVSLDAKQRAYNSSFVLPNELLAPTYWNLSSKKTALSKQESGAKLAYYMLLGFWAWNVFDAAYFVGNEENAEPLSFQLFYRNPYFTNFPENRQVETYGNIQFQWSF